MKKATKHLKNAMIAAFWFPFLKTVKVYGSVKLFAVGAFITCIKAAFERDHIISWNLTSNLFILIMIDTALGVWKHWKNKSLSSAGFGGFATKIIIYWLFLKVINIIAAIQYLNWTGDLLVSGLVIRESLSIVENMDAIKPGLIPKWIVSRLKIFNETGKTDGN